MIKLSLKFRSKLIIFRLKSLFGSLIFAMSLSSSFAQGLSPYSTEELEQLEKEFIQLINQSSSIERNPLASQFINSIGHKLAKAGHIKAPYFFIVKSKEINAFAGPGGYIGINSQLILTTSNESELAAVMAHEIAHVRLHHLYSLMEHQKQMRIPMLASLLASAALGVLSPTAGMGAMMASLSGFSQNNINFTRSKEKEADRIGIDMLIKSGFNPKGMAAFFKKMQDNARYYYTANIPAILRTHPLDGDRIAEAENRTPPSKQQQHQDSLDYYLLKEIIRVSVATEQVKMLQFYEHHCSKTKSISCEYGYALVLLNNNQFEKASNKLSPLLEQYPDNLNFQIAQAQAESGLKNYSQALSRLSNLLKTYPSHYAVIMIYSQVYLESNQALKAVDILLKGSRIYKLDLPLCHALARAQSEAHQKSYAYFTQSQCLLLQGQKQAAVAQLKVALQLATHDAYLKERILAKIEEIKFI